MPMKALESYSKQEQEIMADLGAKVRELREQAGLSQEKLAEQTDVHRTYISGLERGRQNISLLTMMKLAESLGVSLASLIE
jgi:transcriptional regulator with XRE-family HTH domain